MVWPDPDSRYRRLARRMFKKKALVATGNPMLTIIHALLSDPAASYQDLGADYYEQRMHAPPLPRTAHCRLPDQAIPARSVGHTHRAIGTPKLAFTDTGIACHLIGQDAGRLAEPDGAAGQMIETFVMMELARQLRAGATPPGGMPVPHVRSCRYRCPGGDLHD